MAPWIVLALAGILGAAIGGTGGFVLGIIGGVAFNVVVGTLYSRSQLKAQQGAAGERLRRVGAPPPPYPLDPEDHTCAQRIAAMLPGSVVRQTQGNFGPQLEVLVPSLSEEPLAIFSRVWDPDERRVGTLLLCSGNVQAPIIEAAAKSGLKVVGDAGPFTMFTRY
jgi:hypothetical protein